MKKLSVKTKGAILSILILLFALFVWHQATTPKKLATGASVSASSEYEALMGKGGIQWNGLCQ
jgi:nitrate/nitrite transport system permease protein